MKADHLTGRMLIKRFRIYIGFLLSLCIFLVQGCVPIVTGIPPVDAANVAAGVVVYSVAGISALVSDETETQHYKDLVRREQDANKEIERLTTELSKTNEKVIFADRVHFILNRREDVGRRLTNIPLNDVMLITDDKVIISENYVETPSLPEEENASLRPHKVYTYEINNITNIEWFLWKKKAPLARSYNVPVKFAVNLRSDNEENERFYITLMQTKKIVDDRKTKYESNEKENERLHQALKKNRDIPYVDASIRCLDASENELKDYAFRTHCCPNKYKHGPTYKCDRHARESGNKWSPFYSDWTLYYKTGSEFSAWNPWFSTTHQWLGLEHLKNKYTRCPEDIDLWSSDKNIADNLIDANTNHVLYIGDSRTKESKDYSIPCAHIYSGSESLKEFTITDCEENWYRVGGRTTEPCKGMNGVKVRRYTIGTDNCYLYEKVEGLKTIDEHYNRN